MDNYEWVKSEEKIKSEVLREKKWNQEKATMNKASLQWKRERREKNKEKEVKKKNKLKMAAG